MKEFLQELADSKDKNDDDDEQIDDPSNEIVIQNEDRNHSDDVNVEEAQLLKKEAELPIEELLKRYNDDGKYFQSPIINKRTTQNPLTKDIEETTNELKKLKELYDSI